jgi:hypothetical protein
MTRPIAELRGLNWDSLTPEEQELLNEACLDEMLEEMQQEWEQLSPVEQAERRRQQEREWEEMRAKEAKEKEKHKAVRVERERREQAELERQRREREAQERERREQEACEREEERGREAETFAEGPLLTDLETAAAEEFWTGLTPKEAALLREPIQEEPEWAKQERLEELPRPAANPRPSGKPKKDTSNRAARPPSPAPAVEQSDDDKPLDPRRKGSRDKELEEVYWHRRKRRKERRTQHAFLTALRERLGGVHHRDASPVAMGKALELTLAEKLEIEQARTSHGRLKGWGRGKRPYFWHITTMVACDATPEGQAAVYEERRCAAEVARRKAKRKQEQEAKKMEAQSETIPTTVVGIMDEQMERTKAQCDALLEALGGDQCKVAELMERLRHYPAWRDYLGDKVRFRRAILDRLDMLHAKRRIGQRYEPGPRASIQRIVRAIEGGKGKKPKPMTPVEPVVTPPKATAEGSGTVH